MKHGWTGGYTGRRGHRSVGSSLSSQRVQLPFHTGFGPFRQHVVNASWEVVKELKVPGTVLVKIEVPVVYGKADEVTSRIWKTYNPKVCHSSPFNLIFISN